MKHPDNHDPKAERARLVAESRAFQLVLCALQTDTDGSVDAITRAIAEWEFCSECSLEVLLALLNMVCAPIDGSEHRDRWIAHIEQAFSERLDQIARR